MKKNKKQVVIEDDEKFIIYQMSYGNITDPDDKFRPSQVCSPYFGSKVLDRKAYIDNKGQTDVDFNYDYARREDEKHLTEDDIVERYGSKYHEFQILDNKKIAEYAGVKLTDPEEDIANTKIVPEEKIENSFISSIDDIMNDETLEEPEEKEEEYLDEDIDITINIDSDPSDNLEYINIYQNMLKREITTIPNF